MPFLSFLVRGDYIKRSQGDGVVGGFWNRGGAGILDLENHSMTGSWKQYNVLSAKLSLKESIPWLVIGFFGRGPRIVTSL